MNPINMPVDQDWELYYSSQIWGCLQFESTQAKANMFHTMVSMFNHDAFLRAFFVHVLSIHWVCFTLICLR